MRTVHGGPLKQAAVFLAVAVLVLIAVWAVPRTSRPEAASPAPSVEEAKNVLGDVTTTVPQLSASAKDAKFPEPVATTKPGPGHPNVVLILTDDQRYDDMDVLPSVRALLGDHGITFPNSFVSTPLCCPSRASLLTGRYSSNTNVYDNEAPNGGVQAFDDNSTIATWLRNAGYDTSFVGKYLNGYELLPDGQSFVPPGWTDWHGFAPKDGAYYNYELNENGVMHTFGKKPSDYLTDVLAKRATSFIKKSDRPYFLLFAPYAPHLPAVPAPQDVNAFAKNAPFRPPGYNLQAAPGTPAGALPPLTSKLMSFGDTYRKNALASLLSVDRAVTNIFEAVRARGQLNNTVFLFTSDNGLLLGEHRIIGKIWPYEQSIRVPLLARVPWSDARRTDNHMVLNVDLAPTIASLAGVTPGRPVDGASLVPLLRGQSPTWRDHVLIEYLGDRQSELVPPKYSGIRTGRYKLIVYEDGSKELFDLKVDPNELVDIANLPGSASIENGLLSQLDKADPHLQSLLR